MVGKINNPNPTNPVAGAQTAESTGDKKPTLPPLEQAGVTRAPNLAATAPMSKPGDLIAKLAAADTAYKTMGKFTQVNVTGLSMEFRCNIKLQPGEQAIFEIPQEIREGLAAGAYEVFSAAVVHSRGAPGYTREQMIKGERDSAPALSAVHFHDSAHTESWRKWGTPWGSSGDQGAKFAEPGHQETENFFDIQHNGHQPYDGGSKSSAALRPDAIRVRSVGKSPVDLSGVQLHLIPKKPSSNEEVIFTPGSSMGDPWGGKGPTHGGGPRKAGPGENKYPGSIELGGYGGGEGVGKLPSNWKIVGSELHIELPAGKKLVAVEVNCGDTHKEPKSDGKTEQRGYAKLAIGVSSGSGSPKFFTRNQNVPPRGIIMGAPTGGEYTIKPGDKLVVQSSADTTFVMGLRVNYRD